MINTIHAYTNDQRILDRSHNDRRRARAGAENIIPTTSGATKTLGEVIPALAGKFHRISYRVPTLTISVIDLVAKLERAASVAEINAAFAIASSKSLAGLPGYTDLPLVSSDFRGDSRSSIVDGLITVVLTEGDMIHVVGWYDNEWGYACRVADLASFISECEHSGQRLKRIRLVEREYIERTLRMVSFAPEELPL